MLRLLVSLNVRAEAGLPGKHFIAHGARKLFPACVLCFPVPIERLLIRETLQALETFESIVNCDMPLEGVVAAETLRALVAPMHFLVGHVILATGIEFFVIGVLVLEEDLLHGALLP